MDTGSKPGNCALETVDSTKRDGAVVSRRFTLVSPDGNVLTVVGSHDQSGWTLYRVR